MTNIHQKHKILSKIVSSVSMSAIHSFGSIVCTMDRNLHSDFCMGSFENLPIMHQMLSSNPAILHQPQPNGLLPLHHACKSLHPACVKYLLKSGASAAAECPNSGNNAIYFTIFSHFYPKQDPRIPHIINLLLEYRRGEKIYRNEENFKTDFTALIDFNLNHIVKILLEKDEYINNLLPENDFPKIYSASFGFVTKTIFSKNIDCMKLLLLHGNEFSNYVFKNRKFSGTPTKMLKLYKQNALRPLRLFYNFGGNMRTTHQPSGLGRDPKNVLEYLRDCPNQSQNLLEVEDEIRKMMNTPLSLKAQSRLAIWKHLKTDYWWKIQKFEVPEELINFLQLKDL